MNISRMSGAAVRPTGSDVRSFVTAIWPVAILALVAVVYVMGSANVRGAVYAITGFLALGVFATRLWRERDLGIGPGAILTLAIGLLVLGDVTYFHHEWLFGTPAGFPGIPDVLYQLGGVGVVAALGLIIVRARPDYSDAVDAALISTVLAIVSWFFLIEPYATDPTLDLASKMASIAFPATSVLIFGMVSWVILARARLTRTSLWLIAGLVLYYGADMIYVRQAIDGSYQAGWLDLGWVLGYGCWILAALCRSPILGAAPPRRSTPLNRKRVLWLASVGMLGPAVLLVSSRRGIDIDAAELVVGCVSLFLLALVRMALLASALDTQRAELAGLVTQLEVANTDRRKLLSAVLASSEAERSRLAVELHDGSIQHLSAINLELELALMALREADAEQAADCLANAQEGVQREVTALRTVMRDLRPPSLNESGLRAAMDDYAQAFVEREGVRCVIESDVECVIDPLAATILYRVFQEALGRSGVNPEVGSVSASLTEVDGHIVLEVEDDGGVALLLGSDTGHDLALEGLRERVEMAGGVLEVTPNSLGGTVVAAALPLRKETSVVGSEEALVDR